MKRAVAKSAFGKLWSMSRRGRVAALAVAGLAAFALLVGGAGAVAGSDTITTLAGNGVAGYSGDGGQTTSAQLNSPRGVAVDSSGNVYIADNANNRIRKVSGGTITTVAGTGVAGYSGDGGQATSAQLKAPAGVAVDGSGNLYIADSGNNRIRKVSSSGIITTIAGTGVAGYSGDGGQGTSAQINTPIGDLAVDGNGNIFFGDTLNNRVRKIASNGNITTVAGTGVAGYSGDGGQATSAQVNSPVDAAVDAAGNLYFVDRGNNRVRRVTASGTISTIAGTGVAGFSGDGGPATSAQLGTPNGVAVDKNGNVYIADYGNQRIRRVTSSGTITTIAGTGTAGFAGDGGPASAAQLNGPISVTTDQAGNVYLAEYGGHRIRKIANTAPTASFTATPESGQAPLQVAFNGSASSDPGGTIASYDWDFGDGQKATGATTSHAYGAAGTFTAKLTVTDDGGATASAQKTITVTSPPPPFKLTVGGTTSQRPLSSKRITVTGRCSAACTLTATGSIAVSGGKVTLGRAQATLTAAGTATLRLGLSKSSQSKLARLLKKGKTARATVTVRAVDANGKAASGVRRITVRR